MFTDIPDDEIEVDDEAPDSAASIADAADIHPLDQLAFHIDGALETKSMLDEEDALAAARPQLERQYIAQLECASTKVTEALHLARQRVIAAEADQLQPSISFADRVEASRGDIQLT